MKKQKLMISLFFSLMFVALLPFAKADEVGPSEGAKLNKIITQFTEDTKSVDLFYAPYFNLTDKLGEFGDYLSPEYFKRDRMRYDIALQGLKNIDPKKLTDSETLTYLLFKNDMATAAEKYKFPVEYTDFNQMGNRLRDILDESDPGQTNFPFKTLENFRAYLQKAKGFPSYVERQIRHFKKGIEKKVVLNCEILDKTRKSYAEAFEANIEKSPFYRPASLLPKEVAQADADKFRADLKETIQKVWLPGFQKIDDYLAKDYVKSCRKSYGLTGLPEGKAWYRWSIKSSTDLELTPEWIHKQGLKEVARIEKELQQVQKDIGFEGSYADFKKSLGDPKYNFKTSDEMLKAFKDVKDKVSTVIPQYFSLTPKGDYNIVESGNPEAPVGAYNSPTETSPVGKFVINAKNLNMMPIFGVTTLSLHEAIPGHHFQLALQFEMKDKLSEYQRKIFSSNAFEEGWALYSEYLGREMGMFQDPVQKLGNLNDEMLRAVRLVVDTGIHSKGWDHQKTVAYMREHLLQGGDDVEQEAYRYSVWPGQALAYKVGQIKILELRKEAETKLGKKFDIKGFHEAVIGNGTVSLPILESQVHAWTKKVTALP